MEEKTYRSDPQKEHRSDPKARIQEEIRVRGNELVGRVKELAQDASARRIIIKRKGRIILSFSVPTGLGGVALAIALAPKLAAVGAIAVLVSNLEVIVEREPTKDVVVRTETEDGEPEVGESPRPDQ